MKRELDKLNNSVKCAVEAHIESKHDKRYMQLYKEALFDIRYWLGKLEELTNV